MAKEISSIADLRRKSEASDEEIESAAAAYLADGATKPRPAEMTLQKIQERREALAAGLSEYPEAVVVIASAPGGPCFYVADIELISAELISFRGLDDDGETVEVVQHASQCNVTSLPIQKAAARGALGFKPGPAYAGERGRPVAIS